MEAAAAAVDAAVDVFAVNDAAVEAAAVVGTAVVGTDVDGAAVVLVAVVVVVVILAGNDYHDEPGNRHFLLLAVFVPSLCIHGTLFDEFVPVRLRGLWARGFC